MLSDIEKRILKSGNFMIQTSLLLDHMNDDNWIKEARAYFHKCNPNIDFSKKSKKTDE